MTTMKRLLLLLLLAAAAAPAAAAREVYPLNEGWRFFFKSENSSDAARYVTLPHSWNTDPLAEGSFLRATGNYQKDLYIPEEWSSKRLFVRFYGVQSVADLFVNGRHAGEHRGGGTAFAFEITDKVRFGADNALLVIASNAERNDVLPTSTDHNLYGGIYREAELIVTDATAISPLYLGTDGVLVRTTTADAERAAGTVEVHLAAQRGIACMVTVDISGPDGRRSFLSKQRVHTDGQPVTVPFTVERPELWSPDRPALYTVTAVVSHEGRADSVRLRTGFRRLEATEQGLMINGRRQAVRGVVMHHDNALAGGTLTAADYDADLRFVEDLGATALRSSLMPHAPYLYDRCDERGVLVWIDIPFHRAFLSDMAYLATPAFEQNGLEQLREVIAQNMNHPSVAMWGLFSHLWGRGDDVIPYLKRLRAAARELDPTRPSVACSDQDGQINFVPDLIVWHQAVGWRKGKTDDVVVWRDLLQKNWSHLRSAICYGGAGMIGHTSYAARSMPETNWQPEQAQTRFHEEYAHHLEGDSLFWGTWIANLFDYGSSRRPYGENCEGLVTLDRRDCKDAYYLYRALWNGRQPTLRLADRRSVLRDREEQSFHVYSSAGEPVLTVGEDTVRMTQYAACQYRSDTVPLNGSVEVRVRAGALRDSMRIMVRSVAKSKRQPVLRRTADQ